MKGEEKLERELDIVKIVSDLRKLSIVFKKQLAKDDNIFTIENSRRSIILLDSSDDSQNEENGINTELQDVRRVTEGSDYDNG